jgi:hypothetical protein
VGQAAIELPGGQLITEDDLRASIARDDPCWWVENILGETLWSKQREILESVRDHRRTAVQTCHNTGKSWTAGRAAGWWNSRWPIGESFVVTSAPTAPQVKAILWREIGRAHAGGQLVGRTNQTEWWATPPSGKEEMIAFGRKPAEFDPDAFQGIHARYVLVIFDEACGMPGTLWTAADTLLANEDSHFLAIGNPDDPTSEFAEICKPGSGWHVIQIGYQDTPSFTGEDVPDSLRRLLISPTWVEEKREKWGEGNPLFIAKALGRFPEHSTDGLIPLSWVRAAQARDLVPCAPAELGVDVGGGGDRSVIAHRRGAVVRIIQRDTNPDTMQTCGSVVAALRDTGATLAKVDEIGIGRGVVDRAKEQDKPVIGINVGQSPYGSSPEETEKAKAGFVNLRAQGYWQLRERFQEGEIDIDSGDEDLAAQLVDIKYKRTSTGKIQIESKDELQRRGKPSPDDADAVMLSFLLPPPVEEPATRATWGGKRW